jgi:vesicle transport protein SEC22
LQSRVEEADPGIMVKLTMIARVTDGLPLAEGLDDGRDQKDLEFYKQQAKQLCKRLSQQKQGASRMSVETGPYFFHYLIEGGVCYLTLCDRSYPKKLAYQYLEELQREFEKVNRSQIETVARPYAFIKFGMAFFESFVSFSFDAFFCIYIYIYFGE